MTLNRKFVVGLTVFLVFGAGSVSAQVCPNDLCDPGEDSASCPEDCAGLCGTCTATTTCETGLYCDRGACCEDGKICTCNPTSATTFDEMIDKILDFIFYIAMAIIPIMFIIAAFYIITAAGDARRMSTGKTIIIWTLVGGSIILLSKGIIEIIKMLLGS